MRRGKDEEKREDEGEPMGKRRTGSPGFILHKQLFRSTLRSQKSSESLPASQCRSVYSHRISACSHHKATEGTKDLCVYTVDDILCVL